MTDPHAPQWEDCKVCGSSEHWTKDHRRARPIETAIRGSAEWRADVRAARDRVDPDPRGTGISDSIDAIFDGVFAIPTEAVDPDTGRVSRVDPVDVKDAALGVVVAARGPLSDLGMGERARAVELATRVLDDASRDPDSDLSILARQLLRAIDSRQPHEHGKPEGSA